MNQSRCLGLVIVGVLSGVVAVGCAVESPTTSEDVPEVATNGLAVQTVSNGGCSATGVKPTKNGGLNGGHLGDINGSANFSCAGPGPFPNGGVALCRAVGGTCSRDTDCNPNPGLTWKCAKATNDSINRCWFLDFNTINTVPALPYGNSSLTTVAYTPPTNPPQTWYSSCPGINCAAGACTVRDYGPVLCVGGACPAN